MMEFRPDPTAYLRAHAIMALVGGVLAGIVLILLDNPDPWVGPVAAVLAIGIRGAYVRSEALAEVWRLTDTHLTGPGGRSIPRAQITQARPFLGAVQIVTASGDKHLIRYLPDPAAAARAIQPGPRT
jgi:xanthosine utilization system XapX-like protein